MQLMAWFSHFWVRGEKKKKRGSEGRTITGAELAFAYRKLEHAHKRRTLNDDFFAVSAGFFYSKTLMGQPAGNVEKKKNLFT